MKPRTAGLAGAAAGLIIGAAAGVGITTAVTADGQGNQSVSDQEMMQICLDDIGLDEDACTNLMESSDMMEKYRSDEW